MDTSRHDRLEFGFGADPFNPFEARRIEVIGALKKTALRDQVLQSCPRVPGVYGMLDRKGQLIYVGKSKSLRNRLLSYFAESNSDEKAGRIIQNARAIQWETQPSEFASLLREQQLIRTFSPRWNVQGVPKRQRPVYLCLGRPPAEYFFMAAAPPQNCVAIEGPFFGASRMRVAIDALNKVFQLRDCSQKQTFHFAEQLSLFPMDHRPGCLRLEVGTCLGPCAAACSRDQYNAQVKAAESFVDGFNDEPLTIMKEKIERASANQQYELAGRAATTLKSLQYLHGKLRRLAKARREFSFVYAVNGYDGRNIWYLVHSGEIAAVLAAPKNPQQYAAIKPQLKHWQAVVVNHLDRGHGAYPHTLQIVSQWFRKHKQEKQKTFAPQHAGRMYYRKSLTA